MFIVVESKMALFTVKLVGKLSYSESEALQITSLVKASATNFFRKMWRFSILHATGRIRYINLNGERIATLRPTDGMLSLKH